MVTYLNAIKKIISVFLYLILFVSLQLLLRQQTSVVQNVENAFPRNLLAVSALDLSFTGTEPGALRQDWTQIGVLVERIQQIWWQLSLESCILQNSSMGNLVIKSLASSFCKRDQE